MVPQGTHLTGGKIWVSSLTATAGLKKLAVIMHRMWLDGSEFRWSDKASTAAH